MRRQCKHKIPPWQLFRLHRRKRDGNVLPSCEVIAANFLSAPSSPVHSLVAYILVAAAGLVTAFLLTALPELRRLRFTQMVFVPIGFLAAFCQLPESSDTGIGTLIGFIVAVAFLGILLAPNIGYCCGAALAGFLDPQDWTPAEEEIALRPIVKLIDRNRYQDAFEGLEALLKKHKPTYEALVLKTKLLNHFEHFEDAAATLFQMLPLSHSTPQQLVVMELLTGLEARLKPSPSRTPAFAPRQLRIAHELVLFQPGASDRSVHRSVPAGEYQVEEILSGRHRWLVLKGESWGNFESCWEAVEQKAQPSEAPAAGGFLQRVAAMQESLFVAIRGKPARRVKEESAALYKEARQLLRLGNSIAALPLLQQASTADPHNYEIAYRLAQTAFQVGTSANPAGVLRKVLAQSRWTDDEERMLKQLQP